MSRVSVFAKPFSIIASLINTVVKASVNLIGINYWFINSHHYSLQWLFWILLQKKIMIQMHKADKGSCSFDDSFYSFKGVKTQILFPFILLFSLRAGERSHIPSSSFAFSPLKAVICHQVLSGRSAGRQEAKKECCHWPVPDWEGRSIREDPQTLSVCTCSSSCKSWFTDAKDLDENPSTSEMDGLCFSKCSLHLFQLTAGPQDFLKTK